MTTRSDLVRAWLSGRRAGRAGDPVTTCPHRPREAGALTLAWVRGYRLGTDERERVASGGAP